MGAKLASLSGVLGATQDRGLSFITSTTFSAVSTVSVDGCFTSSYDNYLILFDFLASGSNWCGMRLRAASTDATGSTYTEQFTISYTTTVQALQSLNASSWPYLSYPTTAQMGVTLDVFAPALARATSMVSRNIRGDGTVSDMSASFYHSTATAYDGFSLIPAAGTISGTLRVYGYRNA